MIKVFVNGGKACIWNSEDIFALRSEHRIVGSLIGCYPRQKCQNSYKYLPLQLLPEEAHLLAEKGLGQLLSSTSVSADPDNSIKEEYLKIRNLQCDEQLKKLNENRLQGVLENVEVISKGKKRKLLEKTTDFNPKQSKPNEDLESVGKNSDNQDNGTNSPELDEVTKKQIVENEMAKMSNLTHDNCLIQLFTEFPFKKTETNVPAEWCFPKTDNEKMRYMVFKDLWEKGYYLTSGVKFGGDFLAYAGDPINFHALYIVICISSDQEFRADDLVVYGRLGNQVKKTVVLASTHAGNVEYISLNWAPDVTNES